MSKPNIYDENFSERMRTIGQNSFRGNYSEFARAVGVAQASLSRWVKGEADPSRSNLVKIAEVTGVDLEWLATGKERKKNKTEETTIPYQTYSGEDAITISQKRLEAAIETLEEVLYRTGKTMKPKGKVEMIMALYELLTDEEPNQKQTQAQAQALIKALELAA